MLKCNLDPVDDDAAVAGGLLFPHIVPAVQDLEPAVRQPFVLVAGEFPAGGLGDEDPRALDEAGVARGSGDDAGHLLHHAELLSTIEHSGGRQDLDAEAQVTHERSCVVQEQRDPGYTLPSHHGRGKVFGQLRLVSEGSGRGVYVGHMAPVT